MVAYGAASAGMAEGSGALSVLLVEDNPDDAFLVTTSLQRGSRIPPDVTHVRDLAMAIEAIAMDTFDIILVDLGLPDSLGVESVRRLVANAPHSPVVVMTGLDDKEVATEAIAAGAQTFIVKGEMAPTSMVRVLLQSVERHRLIRELDLARARQLRERDQFLSRVSHELRSPLAAIHQFSSIVLDELSGPVTDEQRGHLETVLRNVDQLRHMIDDLLDVTVQTTGRLAVHPALLPSWVPVKDLWSELRPAAEAEGIEFTLVESDRRPLIIADPARFNQVLGNIIGNALKFTPPGGKVEVKTGLSVETPPRFFVQVSDTGPGIPDEDQARVFEELYQVNSTDTAGRGGLGLGLFIVRELMVRMGGAVALDSTLGKGTVITLTFPTLSIPEILKPLRLGAGRGLTLVLVEGKDRNDASAASRLNALLLSTMKIREQLSPGEAVVLAKGSSAKRRSYVALATTQEPSEAEVVGQRLVATLTSSETGPLKEGTASVALHRMPDGQKDSGGDTSIAVWAEDVLAKTLFDTNTTRNES